jgi:protein-L-isoaspartate(D-aspartate) O-methyltransferase
MVEYQICRRGIDDERLLSAMLKVPRHLFVPSWLASYSYEDRPLPIGEDQTISQPYIVALMTSILQVSSGDSVLEIGTGSAYQAAILAELAEKVISLERIPELYSYALENLAAAGVEKVEIHLCDGTMGWPSQAPYSRIMVTAGAPEVPRALADQLAEGGRMVIPIGTRSMQELYLVEKIDGKVVKTPYGGCRFVKLLGEAGWKR